GVRRFADLYDAIDATTSTNGKVAALVAYLRQAPPADAAWALWFLTGRRLVRTVGPRLLAEWCLQRTGTPEWMFGECYSMAGDLAEIVALLVDTWRNGLLPRREEWSLSQWIEERLLPLRALPEEEKRAAVLAAWDALEARE